MNTPAFNRLLGLTLATFLTLAPALWAQNPPASTEQAVPVAPEAPPVSSPPAEPEDTGLRRLDIVPETEAPTETKDDVPSVVVPEDAAVVSEAPPVVVEAETTDKDQARERRASRKHRDHDGNARVSVWDNSQLAAGESADAVVSIVGSSTSAGRVNDAVVSILGSSTSSGDVGAGVISILGNSRVTGGRVGDVVVSILGNTYVNAPVHGEVVAVLGNVELGPDAVVHGDLVCVGGAVVRDPKAIVHGEVNNVSIGGHFSGFEGLHAWVSQCLMKVRPLAFGPHLMWAWWIAIGFLILYVLIAALFPRGVTSCIETLEQRPGYSLLTALLVFVITPFAAVLLAFTIVGAPVLVLFLIIATLFGKAVMIAWIGRQITRPFGGGPLAHPAFAVIVGGFIVLGLYTIPVVGFITMKLLSWLGQGVVVYALLLWMKRNRASRVPVAPAAAIPVPPVAGVSGPGVVSETFAAGAEFAGPEAPGVASGSAVPPPFIPAPMVVSAATLHRAGFWIRIAASVLDAILVGLAVVLLPPMLEPNFLLAYAIYCIVLWALKGTTIGGIVCNLKVVRLDDRPVDWATALVRGLAGFLSCFAAGIGFIWVAFDDQRQSWHDKIAGTTIVHVPKGVPLV